jgi:hypothetical protein
LHRTEAGKSSKASDLAGGGVPNPTSWLMNLASYRSGLGTAAAEFADDEFELVDVDDSLMFIPLMKMIR